MWKGGKAVGVVETQPYFAGDPFGVGVTWGLELDVSHCAWNFGLRKYLGCSRRGEFFLHHILGRENFSFLHMHMVREEKRLYLLVWTF